MMIPAVFALTISLLAMSDNDRLEWANHQMVVHQLPVDSKPIPVKHSELFFKGTKRGANDFVASGGTQLDTAGSGSTWVYDPTHHILAFSERGDITGDQIWYADAPPPFPVRQRDLSNITSPHGIRLGVSLVSALEILRVSPSDVKTLPNGHPYISTTQVLEVIKNGGGAERVRTNNIVFNHDRAIWIELDDACC